MSRNKALAVYLLGTFSQLLLVCLVVFFCNYYAVHSDLINVFGVMIGGISTALWGSIVAIWYYEIDLKKIIKDFFNIQTSYKHYLLAFFLIILDFSFLFFGGKIVQFIWYLPILMFSDVFLIYYIWRFGRNWLEIRISANFTRKVSLFSSDNFNIYHVVNLAFIVLLYRWFSSQPSNSTFFIWITNKFLYSFSSLFKNKESLDLCNDTFND